MRVLLYLLVTAALGAGGFWLGHRAGRQPSAPRREAPRGRNPELERAWRAFFEQRPDELVAALERAQERRAQGGQPEDLRDRDEERLLRALRAADRDEIARLARAEGVATRSVVAAAQRELVRSAPSDEEGSTWKRRLEREFPSSWTRGSSRAFEPR